MTLKRPHMAFALVFASPLFGCVTNPAMVSGRMAAAIAPPPSLQTSWVGYQQLLEQRIGALQILADAIPVPDAGTLSPLRLAMNSETAEQPVVDEQVFDRRILAAHNRERLGLGLRPLSWNPALAQSAKQWARHLALTGQFAHAPENPLFPQGENLWAGTKGYFAPEAMVNAWIREKRHFRPGLFPDNSTTGRVEDVGHYTQLVWRATTEVGCAQAKSRREDILVCRYAEAGNYRGELPF